MAETKMSRTISERAFNGIVAALVKYEPNMLPVLQEILEVHIVGIPNPFGLARGETNEGNLTADVSWEKGQPIVSALERIDCRLLELGVGETFNGLTIDGLKSFWEQFLGER